MCRQVWEGEAEVGGEKGGNLPPQGRERAQVLCDWSSAGVLAISLIIMAEQLTRAAHRNKN